MYTQLPTPDPPIRVWRLVSNQRRQTIRIPKWGGGGGEKGDFFEIHRGWTCGRFGHIFRPGQRRIQIFNTHTRAILLFVPSVYVCFQTQRSKRATSAAKPIAKRPHIRLIWSSWLPICWIYACRRCQQLCQSAFSYGVAHRNVIPQSDTQTKFCISKKMLFNTDEKLLVAVSCFHGWIKTIPRA